MTVIKNKDGQNHPDERFLNLLCDLLFTVYKHDLMYF